MGLILDSSVLITAERKGDEVARFVKRRFRPSPLSNRSMESSAPTPRKSVPGGSRSSRR